MTDTTTTASKTSRPRRVARKPNADTEVAGQAIAKAKAPKPAQAAPERQTKASMVEALLARKEGATLNAMCKATGWQAHTCRAFLTGLRKKGMEIVRDKDAAGTTIYRLGATKEQGAES